MRILLICALDVWSLEQGKGAPTLERTLRAYSDAGHEIDAVLPDIGANHFYGPSKRTDLKVRPYDRRDAGGAAPESRPTIANVRFHTFHMPSLRDLPLPSLPDPALAADQKLRFALAFPWLAAKRAQELIAASPPFDVLYAYEVHAALAARLLRRRGVRLPLVTRFQGTVMHPALKDRMLYYRRYEEALALQTQADLLIMTDDGTQGDEVIARLNPSMTAKMKFWRNGLDLERLRPPRDDERASAREELGVRDGAFVMLTASRLAAWKRIDRAVRAMQRVAAWVPDALLLIVGDGEERARLRALARELGIERNVRFAGAAPQSDVSRYMHAADVFLAVADLSNVGNPLLEAMACGMCVVAVDAGDTRDLIVDGRTGRLVDNTQRSGFVKQLEERLGDLLVQLASDSAQRERLAQAAASYADVHFWTWEQRMAAEVAAVEGLVTVPESGERSGGSR
jgi:glycosyltransferase involved in cell wall biosynthesis